MDIEKMKKINELAGEMKKHRHLPDDAREVFNQAEQIVLSDEDEKLSETNNSSVIPEQEKKQDSQKDTGDAGNISQEKTKIKMHEDISLLKKAILQLNDEFKQFRKDINEELLTLKRIQKEQPEAISVTPSDSSEVSENTRKDAEDDENSSSKDKDKKPADSAEEKKEDYSPGGADVAVENVFYMGNK